MQYNSIGFRTRYYRAVQGLNRARLSALAQALDVFRIKWKSQRLQLPSVNGLPRDRAAREVGFHQIKHAPLKFVPSHSPHLVTPIIAHL